ncbi:MAG TPA: ComF family protein [Actinomycetota bacterium]
MLRAVADVIYPKVCVACGRGGWPFCPSCWKSVAVLAPPGCRRCGRPYEAAVAACRDCPGGNLAWSRSAFLYDGPVRHVLMRLKFGKMRSFAEAVAPWMLEAFARAPPTGWSGAFTGSPSDVLTTWVPLGRRRKRERGYDQAEMLARDFAAFTGSPLRRLLDRTVETPPQATRSGADRRRALRGAFSAISTPPARVVLVDDVLTTGATASECARTLLAAGARQVGAITVARSLGGPLPTRCYTRAGLQPGSVVARETFSR